MQIEDVTYDRGCRGTVHVPPGAGRRPGVVVFPDAWGMTPFVKGKARKVAEAGYVALAGDYYGAAHVCASFEEAGERADRLSADPGRMTAMAQAALDHLAGRPDVDPQRIAVLGYCLGGAVALNVARRGLRCAAAVSYHGILRTPQPAEPGGVHTRLLVCTGADDPLAPLTDVVALQHEMTAARADCQVVVYTGAGHSFTREDASVRPGFGYHPLADRRSWQLTLQLLQEAFA